MSLTTLIVAWLVGVLKKLYLQTYNTYIASQDVVYTNIFIISQVAISSSSYKVIMSIKPA